MNKIEEILAQDVAYFLFDDFETIGKSNTNAIHIFDLDGIFFPLSVMLYGIANGIEQVITSPQIYIDFSIKSGKILYPNSPTYTHEMWINQAEYGMKTIDISMKFFKNFAAFIKKFL